MDFSACGLTRDLSQASNPDLDELSFGLVRMDKNGTVTYYNAYESGLSGLTADQVVGRDFFTEVAPCTNNHLVARRYDQESLDELVDYVFTYRMKPTPVRLRLLKDPGSPHQFLLVQRR